MTALRRIAPGGTIAVSLCNFAATGGSKSAGESWGDCEELISAGGDALNRDHEQSHGKIAP